MCVRFKNGVFWGDVHQLTVVKRLVYKGTVKLESELVAAGKNELGGTRLKLTL